VGIDSVPVEFQFLSKRKFNNSGMKLRRGEDIFIINRFVLMNIILGMLAIGTQC